MIYVPLGQWSPNPRGGDIVGQASLIIIHHWYIPDVPPDATLDEEKKYLRAVENAHIKNGWGNSTGYNWNIADSGMVYEGRGTGRKGAHTAGQNWHSRGIAFMNNGDVAHPSPKAWKACKELIKYLVATGDVKQGFTLAGHHDYADYKSCPGTKVYPVLADLLKPDTPPVTQEDDVKKWLIRVSNTPEVYVTDWLTKRHIKSEQELKTLVHLGAVVTTFPSGVTTQPVNNVPAILLVDSATAAGIPTK